MRRIEEHDEEDGEEPLDVCFPPTPSFSSPSPWPFGYRKCYNTPRIDMSVFNPNTGWASTIENQSSDWSSLTESETSEGVKCT